MLLLNALWLKNEQIAQGQGLALSTVRHTIHRWQKKGLVGLWDTHGRGGKPRYSESDLVALETYIKTNPRSSFLWAGASSTLAQQVPPSLTQRPPNQRLNVQRQAGTCPQTVGLWTILVFYEGGADHTVVADTSSIANSAKVAFSGKKFVEYEAPLQRAYTSCVGQATSAQLRSYSFRFRNGNVYFRVDVGWTSAFTEIRSKSLASGRPYVRWRAEE